MCPMRPMCPAQDGDVEGGKCAEDLKDELLGSGDVVLVEASPEWFTMENPIKMDDLVVPCRTPILGNPQLEISTYFDILCSKFSQPYLYIFEASN